LNKLLFCIFAIQAAFASNSTAKNVELRIHCWEGYSEPYIEGFKDYVLNKYDIRLTMKVTHVSSPEEFWNVARNRQADLICPAHNLFEGRRPFVKYDVVIPLNMDNIPNYQNVKMALRDLRFAKKRDSIHGVPYAMGVYGLAYNADKVEEPDSWKILWNSKSKNRYSISKDYPDANMYITALSLGVPFTHLYDVDMLLDMVSSDQLQRQLSGLAENSFSMWEGIANHTEFDELHYATTWGNAVLKANMNGLNWKMASPVEGDTAFIDYWAVTYDSLRG